MSDKIELYVLITFFLLIPLFIGLTSSDKMYGAVRGIVAIPILIGLPLLYTKYKTKDNEPGSGMLAPYIFLSSFVPLFIIVVIAMFVTNT